MDQRKIFRILEYLWLATASLGVITTVYFLIMKDTDSALYFFFVFLIGCAMYLTRRYQRRKQDERNVAATRQPKKKN